MRIPSNGLDVDKSVSREVAGVVADLSRLSGGVLSRRDVALQDDQLVALSEAGRIFLAELDRATGSSAAIDAQDGRIDRNSVVHVRQLAKKGSVALAMINGEVLPLFRGVDAQSELLELLETRKRERKDAKDALEDQAKRDIEGLSDAKWQRSFFTKDEVELATEARFRELWTRTDSRKLRALDAQIETLESIIEKERAASSDPAAREALRSLKLDFIELGASASLNDKLGSPRQWLSALKHTLRKIGLFSRPDQYQGGAALDVTKSGDASKNDPIDSRLFDRRPPEEVTPERLHTGPWWKEGTADPGPNGLLTLLGFRDRTADGAHASVVTKNEKGEEVQAKFFGKEERTLSNAAISSRLLHAMGLESEGVIAAKRRRMEARAVLAAFENVNRPFPGIPLPDDQIPGVGGPTKKIGFGKKLNEHSIDSVEMHDGRTLHGVQAVTELNDAKRALRAGDRSRLDAIKEVVVKNIDLEFDGPTSSIGPWNFDRLGHQDRRDIRAVGIVFESWLGAWDIKMNNVRTDIRKKEGGGVDVLHVLSDADSPGVAQLPWTVGLTPEAARLHIDAIRYDVVAPDRTTLDDAKWGIRLIASLSEEQILACVAAGTFDSKAGQEYFEKLLARRDDMVKSFGLEGEFGLKRPDGPRAYTADWNKGFALPE